MIERETFGSAVETGVEALKLLGVHSYQAHRAARTFKEHHAASLAGDGKYNGR